MQRIIEDYTGKQVTVECLGCMYRERGTNVPGFIVDTDLFHAHQDFVIPIPGFVILTTKRHIKSVDEFTPEESRQFMDILIRIRKALRSALGIKTVYLVQEEDALSGHFHLWIFPRYDWMEEKFGREMQSIKPILEYALEHMKTEENTRSIHEAVKKLCNYLK